MMELCKLITSQENEDSTSSVQIHIQRKFERNGFVVQEDITIHRQGKNAPHALLIDQKPDELVVSRDDDDTTSYQSTKTNPMSFETVLVFVVVGAFLGVLIAVFLGVASAMFSLFFGGICLSWTYKPPNNTNATAAPAPGKKDRKHNNELLMFIITTIAGCLTQYFAKK